MAYCPPTGGTWIHFAQIHFLRRLGPEVQLDSIKHSISLCMWSTLLSTACSLLSRGGFPSIRHNDLRDLTASLLKETCHGVATEPSLQPITSETFNAATVNTQDGARLDIVANGFWGGAFERAFFDVRVFKPFAPSNRHSSSYRHHESLKKRLYERRVREVEYSSFTPLVFSFTGGLGPAATAFYKCLASQLSDKWKQPYSSTIGWLHCRISFSLLRSSIMCLRGARSSHTFNSHLAASVDLTISDSNLSL